MSLDLVDAGIMCLLVGTVGYAFILDRRVRALMAALRTLGPAIDAFASAADRTESTVARLRDPVDAAVRHDPAEPSSMFQSARRPGGAPAVIPATVKADLIRRFFHDARAGSS